MKEKQQLKGLIEALSMLIAEETDEFVVEELEEDITDFAKKVMGSYTGLFEDELDDLETEEDLLDFYPDMDNFSEDD